MNKYMRYNFLLFERLATACSSQASKIEVLPAYAELKIIQPRKTWFLFFMWVWPKRKRSICFIRKVVINLYPLFIVVFFERWTSVFSSEASNSRWSPKTHMFYRTNVFFQHVFGRKWAADCFANLIFNMPSILWAYIQVVVIDDFRWWLMMIIHEELIV